MKPSPAASVVVMPTTAAFTPTSPTLGYWQYLAEELPQYLANLFALRPAREDTLVAGLSMGGYGAMKCALLHPERYAAAAAFSGVLSLAIFQTHAGDERQDEFAHIFGDLRKLPGSQHDPAVWLANAAKNPAGLPRLYVSCGTADDLLPLNRLFKMQCAQLGVRWNIPKKRAPRTPGLSGIRKSGAFCGSPWANRPKSSRKRWQSPIHERCTSTMHRREPT